MRARPTIIWSIAALVLLGGCRVFPEPLTDVQLTTTVVENKTNVTADQEPITAPISLYDAMARALKYNLDHRVEQAEAAVRTAELNLAHYNMLPSAVANSGYAGRSNDNASSSLNLVSGAQNFGASTSQEREIRTSDIGFSWHILDFGLSYIRARQDADKVLIQDELRRKVVQRVVEDVRTAYWRAVSADRLMSKLTDLESATRDALEKSRKMFDAKDTSPILALTYERELVEIKAKIGEIQRELNTAKAQLAALMNVAPGEKFQLSYTAMKEGSVTLDANLDEMVDTAIYNRPELREVEYRKRINAEEARAALLEMLPGVQLYAGANLDSNDFLLNQDWVNWGAKASWNLMKVFSYRDRQNMIALQDDMLHQRSLALTMAVMTQVHVARIRFFHETKELRTAAEYRDVQRRLLEQLRAEAAADRISNQTLIREEMNTLVAEAKYDMAYALLQNAFANLFSSMGLTPYDWELDPMETVAGLAGELEKLWVEQGDVSAGWKKKRLAAAEQGANLPIDNGWAAR
jgi:outer membrane protein TolC